MKEINLNNVPYLRGKIISASIDESSINFQNGLALVQANITSTNGPQGVKTYTCWGLINEEYQEAYSDKPKVPESYERNLMFLGYNRQIERVSPTDFIVKVACGDEIASYNEYRHIRIVDGIPVLINKIGTYEKTSKPNLLISGWQSKKLYDISKKEYITPEVSEIVESPAKDGTFNVTIRISDAEVLKYPFSDYIYFKIDAEGNIVSQVLSALNNGSIDITGISDINELIIWVSHNLKARLLAFQKALSAMQKENRFSDIKRIRKNPKSSNEE